MSNEMNNVTHFGKANIYSFGGHGIKSAVHFIQNTRGQQERVFRKFDYGEQQNKLRYGQIAPPSYDLSSINKQIFLAYGNKDRFLTQENIDHLIEDLSKKSTLKSKLYEKWGHMSFVYGINTPELVQDVDEFLRS